MLFLHIAYIFDIIYSHVGKYYLVDLGYANTGKFIAPYRGERYHISQYSRRGNTPYRSIRDKFNHQHAQLRNTVERTFGVLKMRFATLKEGNMYPFRTSIITHDRDTSKIKMIILKLMFNPKHF